ncbi:DNase I-like protein [Russula earlei]|uniref:DNase I-like protein n=1 Tax=Russula earlei TaxID=71964 RepID=A0ACC0UQ00_9AGAM|nr:DNase I-like protein [Russula earlei]
MAQALPRPPPRNQRPYLLLSYTWIWQWKSLEVCLSTQRINRRQLAVRGHSSYLVLQRTLAIHSEFSLVISQLSNPPPTQGLGDVLTEIKPPTSLSDTRFCVRLSDDSSTYTVFADDIERLSLVASACRRLRDSASKSSNHANSHRWLEPYALHPASWLSVKPPRDLRRTCQPVHASLSLSCAGQPVHDVADYTVICDDWLWSRSLSLAAVRMTSEKKQLTIRVGTFNVNGNLPTQDLSPWLGIELPSTTAQDGEQSIPPLVTLSLLLSDNDAPEGQVSIPEADILVMAFQEADLSTEALFNFTGVAREDAWTAAILATLGEKAEQYEKLTSKQLVGILLIVFVKKDSRGCFTEIMESSVASGFMVSVTVFRSYAFLSASQGVMGNKGAVAVRLGYRPNPTSSVPTPVPIIFTFVNSHLAAFDDQIERRNADFTEISQRIEFGPSSEYVWVPRTKSREAEPQVVNMYASDVLFWLKDLNYRLTLLDADVRYTVSSGLKSQAIKTLLRFDELKSSIRHSKAFTEFNEYPINFLPTYRFAANVQTDALGYDTKRKPAWTDRVLHKSSPSISITQKSYEAHPSITMSDHKPVSAEFLVDIPCIDPMALDLAANSLRSAFNLDESTLDFGKVSYSTPVTKRLRIQNTGEVPAAFRFLSRDHDSPIHPLWLKIEPMAGLLLPRDEMTLQFTIFVSNSVAAKLNLGMQRLSTLLIVHTLFGQDLFVFVHGVYEPSCFGTPLSALARLRGPIRELTSAEDLLPETDVGHSSREFMRLMSWLTSHEVEAIHDLFIAPGDEGLAAQIRETTVDADYARTVAAVLLAFLRSLPESVVPSSLHQRCAETNSRDAALEMLSAFPPASVNAWITVTAFLHFLASRDPGESVDKRVRPRPSAEGDDEVALPPTDRHSRAEMLASIFVPVLLRDDIDATPPVSLLGKTRFLLFFMGGS